MSNGMVESGTTSNNLRKDKWERKSLKKNKKKKRLSREDGRQVGLGPHQDGADQHTTQRAKRTEKSLSNF
jgi:hypothetical protein